ncbi:MAG TPA: hypothetical protein VH595_22450 [Verrucomicrobiae bacterium]|jgi:hypothetical protein|nr:hypothetical protein [Verrucomicrobiae bacterium]
MIRILALSLLAAGCFISCVSENVLYEPATKPEQIEFKRARLDVFPEDVRKDIYRYTNTPVAWVGVIRSTDAIEEDFGGKIRTDTVFEQHYFDWMQETDGTHIKLHVSARGEGTFYTRWRLRKEDNDANAYDAQKFAHPGKLAIVYGVPQSIDDDGTIVLNYHYLRILDCSHFNTNEVDYGRWGPTVSAPGVPRSVIQSTGTR